MSKRTTVTLEDDIVSRLEAEARRTGTPFKDVLNDAVRRGLDRALATPTPPFRVQPRDMGLLPGLSLDDVSGLLEQVDGPDHR